MDSRKVLAASALVAILILISVYMRTPKSTEDLANSNPVKGFIGTVTARNGNTLTVSRFVPHNQNDINSAITTEEEIVKVTQKTTISLLAVNYDWLKYREKVALDRAQRKSLPTAEPSQKFSDTAVPKVFAETPISIDDLTPGSKVSILVQEDARTRSTLTSTEVKRFPDDFVLDPFNSPLIPTQNKK